MMVCKNIVWGPTIQRHDYVKMEMFNILKSASIVSNLEPNQFTKQRLDISAIFIKHDYSDIYISDSFDSSPDTDETRNNDIIPHEAKTRNAKIIEIANRFIPVDELEYEDVPTNVNRERDHYEQILVENIDNNYNDVELPYNMNTGLDISMLNPLNGNAMKIACRKTRAALCEREKKKRRHHSAHGNFSFFSQIQCIALDLLGVLGVEAHHVIHHIASLTSPDISGISRSSFRRLCISRMAFAVAKANFFFLKEGARRLFAGGRAQAVSPSVF